MPRTSGILETSLYVDDLQAAVAFYRDLFDFELFFAEHRMAALGVPGGQILLLFQRGATLDPAPGPGGGFIPPHHGEGNLHLYFRDPEGNSIEVATPGLWPNT
jgi:catechol 2,3-dioxygenase-like lactoylglutathione lyase family enzyme